MTPRGPKPAGRSTPGRVWHTCAACRAMARARVTSLLTQHQSGVHPSCASESRHPLLKAAGSGPTHWSTQLIRAATISYAPMSLRPRTIPHCAHRDFSALRTWRLCGALRLGGEWQTRHSTNAITRLVVQEYYAVPPRCRQGGRHRRAQRGMLSETFVTCEGVVPLPLQIAHDAYEQDR